MICVAFEKFPLSCDLRFGHEHTRIHHWMASWKAKIAETRSHLLAGFSNTPLAKAGHGGQHANLQSWYVFPLFFPPSSSTFT